MNRYYAAIIILFFSLLGTAVVVGMTSAHGVGVSADSVDYIVAGRNMRAGDGYVDYRGLPIYVHPPLYSMVLAGAALLTGRDELTLARWVQAGLMGLNLALAGWLAWRYLRLRAGWLALGLAAMIFAYPLVYVTAWAWTEAFFIFQSLLLLWCSLAWLERPRLWLLACMGALTGLAFLTKFTGVYWGLYVAGLVVGAAGRRQGSAFSEKVGKVVKEGAVTAAAFLLVSAPWLVRNYLLEGRLAGGRQAPDLSFADNWTAMSAALLRWTLPPAMGSLWLGWLSLALLVGGLAWLARGGGRGGEYLRRAGPWIGMGAAYMLMLYATSALIKFDALDDRIIAPVFVPWLLALAALAQAAADGLRRWWWKAALALGALAWLALIGGQGLGVMRTSVSEGFGYHSQAWTGLRVFQYIEKHPQALASCERLYSNRADGVTLTIGKRTFLIPVKRWRVGGPALDISKLQGRWPDPEGCLIWIRSDDKTYMFTLKEIGEFARLEVVAETEDGGVYRVRRLGP